MDAYKLTSTMATTAAYAQQNKYAHSLFVADYAITHTVSWENLNSAGLIFGKGYTSGGVEYTLRAPSVGSSGVGSNYSQHGIPQSNEWDKMLDKDNGYIKTLDRYIRLDKILRAVRSRTVQAEGTMRPASGTAPLLRVPTRPSVSALSLKS
ncbi:hypothetical protein NIA69_20265 [Gemmiger formicilis]|nr:hypothetical protein [Gemmiger formicilis]